MAEVKKCGSRLSNLDQELLGRLTDLQTGFSSKLALPTVHAFPLLMRLARTWQGFQVLISPTFNDHFLRKLANVYAFGRNKLAEKLLSKMMVKLIPGVNS